MNLAIEWLKTAFTRRHWIPSKDIYAEADKAGIGEKNLQRARTAMYRELQIEIDWLPEHHCKCWYLKPQGTATRMERVLEETM